MRLERCDQPCLMNAPSPVNGKEPKEPGFFEYWWPRAESNHRHKDFQSSALPTELLGHLKQFVLRLQIQILRRAILAHGKSHWNTRQLAGRSGWGETNIDLMKFESGMRRVSLRHLSAFVLKYVLNPFDVESSGRIGMKESSGSGREADIALSPPSPSQGEGAFLGEREERPRGERRRRDQGER